ncbi:hypothetical protein PROFUN_00862 [Planoprotostelium fungivorum]|uniref:BAG domain-containing protein n=1 Tax=Planoprotostelium fungivorum TaxID=1890364 RepID=A0A2P6P097_9EUKA|nr:hypothetical protein PROFUN_00862 [Planoprotostelium fungivorum]
MGSSLSSENTESVIVDERQLEREEEENKKKVDEEKSIEEKREQAEDALRLKKNEEAITKVQNEVVRIQTKTNLLAEECEAWEKRENLHAVTTEEKNNLRNSIRKCIEYNECLLKALIILDGVSGADYRQKRKEKVNEVQHLMNHIDKIQHQLTALESLPEEQQEPPQKEGGTSDEAMEEEQSDDKEKTKKRKQDGQPAIE